MAAAAARVDRLRYAFKTVAYSVVCALVSTIGTQQQVLAQPAVLSLQSCVGARYMCGWMWYDHAGGASCHGDVSCAREAHLACQQTRTRLLVASTPLGR